MINTIDYLPLLASSEPLEYSLQVQGRYLEKEHAGKLDRVLNLPAPLDWKITLDETSRPYAKATLVYPTPAARWQDYDPTRAATRARFFLTIKYTWPALNKSRSHFVAGLIITEITHDSEGLTTLSLESDEILLEDVYTAPGASYAVPDDAHSLPQIGIDAQRAGRVPYVLDINIDPTIDAYEIDWHSVHDAAFERQENLLDWLYHLYDAAGIWVHSNQNFEDGGRGLWLERREPARPYGLDLSTRSPFPIVTRREITYTPEKAASILDLAVEWNEGDKTHSLSRRYEDPAAGVKQVARRTLRLRPPFLGLSSVLPDNWPPALDLLHLLRKRTWTATVEARACYWLRPRDTVILDEGPALVSSVNFDGTNSLMTLDIRPY